ncbi:MAG TPA: sigma-70 family RNA polymerase sigma factor [Thermomicrobiales bacterium]|jgi:RNA polymerase sigma-70 factor (ECF subfamily)
MLDTLKVRAVPIERTVDVGDHDADLVARAKRDRQAFAALYDRYVDAIYRYCHVRLGDREAAEDATSVVFAKAMDGLSSCRGGSFRSWLFAIAHNVVADAYRATRPSEPLAAAAALTDPAPEPDELALAGDLGRAVRASLARLSPDQREIVELRLAGLTGPEIAAALGKSHAAIRVAQFRAYARLRILLDGTKGVDGDA